MGATSVRRRVSEGVTDCADCLSEAQLRSLVASHGSPLLIIDCGRVRESYRRMRAALPTVSIHYAVKALPESAVLSALCEEGSHFDIASLGELELLRRQQIPADRVMHTHPIKTVAEIQSALAYGCSTFVYDNADELAKFKPFRDRVQLLLRIAFRNADATVDLSKKFGAAPGDVLPLLELAHSFGLRTVGFSFHVGSQCVSPRAHVIAIETCAELMARASASGLPALRLMDIGGGFPAPYTRDVPTIEEFCKPIHEAVGQLPRHVAVVSEPGRCLVASAGHSVSTVIGRANREGSPWYYLDDGVYGSFLAQIFDGIEYPVSVLSARGAPAGLQRVSHLAGPTCDSGDMISAGILLPDLQIGDRVVSHVMGAYTSVTATDFNSLKRAKVVAINAQESFQGPSEMLQASG